MDPRFDEFEKRIAALEAKKKKESTAEEKPAPAPKAAKKGTK